MNNGTVNEKEDRVTVDLSALIATAQLTPAERERLFHILGDLAQRPETEWPSATVRRLPPPGTDYLLKFDDQLRVFFRPDGEGRIAITDYVAQAFLDRYFGPPGSKGGS